jgi:hypothetical protein
MKLSNHSIAILSSLALGTIVLKAVNVPRGMHTGSSPFIALKISRPDTMVSHDPQLMEPYPHASKSEFIDQLMQRLNVLMNLKYNDHLDQESTNRLKDELIEYVVSKIEYLGENVELSWILRFDEFEKSNEL